MEIIIVGVVCIVLIGALVYLQKLNADTITKMRTIEKAKDIREVHEYLIPHNNIPDEIEEKYISVEDMDEADLAKIINRENE